MDLKSLRIIFECSKPTKSTYLVCPIERFWLTPYPTLFLKVFRGTRIS